ncbi:MAG: chemotaxis protein CheA [Candidatus Marinimicrobia bacterium]|nr:chemotaxis protein CheA [Candidatus Neomarinimicrobiota bacterium]
MTAETIEKTTGMDIISTIEEICEALVLSDPTDFSAMSKLFNRFNGIHEWAQETDNPSIDSVMTPVMQIMENILLEEAEDLEAAFAVVVDSVTALQSVVRDGHQIEDVDFPAELGLNGAEQTAPGANGNASALPPGVDEEIFTEFLSQQDGVMGEMETLILSLEKSNGNGSSSELLRLLHTLKGESALMGLDDVEKLCHRTEDYLNAENTASAVDVLLSVKDWLQNKFTSFSTDTEVPDIKVIFDQLNNPKSGINSIESNGTKQDEETGTSSDTPPTSEPITETEATPTSQAWDVDMELCADFVAEGRDHLEVSDAQLLILESNPEDNDALNTVFRAFHTIKGVAGFLDLTEIGSLAHTAENLLDQVRKGRVALKGATMDITFESLDFLKKMLDTLAQSLATGVAPLAEPELPQLVERLKVINDPNSNQTISDQAPTDQSNEAETKSKPVTEASVPKPSEPKAQTKVKAKAETQVTAKVSPIKSSAPATGAKVSGARPQGTKLKETLKVDTQRIDQMVDAIGELVIAESMVSQSPELKSIASPTLIKHLSQLDKIARELQSMGTSLRMVTIRSVFQKMARLVRDLAKKSGKTIQFNMVGSDTEVDKSVVDKIGDPLIHMIRNAVDHGIEENVQDRVDAGKDPGGQIELRAFHKGGNIYIEVQDDGRGLNRDAILKKALERGMIKKDQKLHDNEVWGLVLEPGFSTAKKVTEISGRGVGMDVVKRNIESLRGLIEIQSTPGEGSLFSIRLPLTLAIIDGMIVRVGSNRYIVPTLSVKESLQPDEASLSTLLDKGEMLKFHDRLIPLLHLNRLFDVLGAIEKPTEALVIVIEADGSEVGLVIDELLGQQQVVIKSLGETMRDISGLSGCTIMPDGQVGLILDVNSLIKDSNDGNYS